MKLDRLKFDKNGLIALADCYCWMCSGMKYRNLNKKTGRGRMTFRKRIVAMDLYSYECIECGYTANYNKRYQITYGIR